MFFDFINLAAINHRGFVTLFEHAIDQRIAMKLAQ